MSQPSSGGTATAGRSIGEILLAHGFVNQQQLDVALAAQEHSGKPLGQILVESEAITRLELATALAEQWSSTSDWVAPPQSADPPATSSWPSTSDSTAAALDPFAALTDPGVEARLKSIEATVAQLGLQGSADVVPLRDEITELAQRLEGFEPALAELEQRLRALAPAADLEEIGGILTRRADELGGRIEALERSLAAGTEQLARLAATAASNAGSLEQLAPLEGRIAELHTRAGATETVLAEIRTSVEELVSLPGADPALGGHVEELASRMAALGARVDALPTNAVVEAVHVRTSSLEAETNALAARIGDLADVGAVEALQVALAEIEARPSGDPELATRVHSVADELRELTGRLEAIAAVSESLRLRLDGLADLEALADLRTTLDDLAARPTSDAELIARVDALAAHLDTRAATDEIEALRTQIAALAERPGGDPSHAARLDELATTLAAVTARLDGLTDVRAELHAELEPLRGNIAALAERPVGDPAHAVLLDQLAHRLGSIDSRLAELEAVEPTAQVADDGRLERRLEELARAVAELTSDLEGTVSLQAALEARVDAAPGSRAVKPRSPGDPARAPEGIEGELDRMLMAIERLSLRMGEHDRALKELVQMQHAAARAGALHAPRPAGGDGIDRGAGAEDGDLRAEVRGLAFRLTEAEEALRSDRDKAFSQIERIASSITWRLQRLEEQSSVGQPDESA